ncbi:MAG: hypothetical protein GDA55_03265, partial [Cellvibrionales bacterium]|nr:hypothetical protein [Cellvibrionales bacterium]
ARQQTPELAPALETLIDTLITESHFPQKTPTLQTTTTKLLQNHHPTDSKAKKINHLKTLTQATQTHPLKTQITQTQSKIKKTSKT